MTRSTPSLVLDCPSGGAVLPVYLGLYLVLLAFFVYFVAVSAAERQTEAVVADEVAADVVRPADAVAHAMPAPAPALRPLAEAFRPLVLPGASGGPGEPDRLDARVSADRIFAGGTTALHPDFAPVLDRVARELTAAPAKGDRADGNETSDLQLLIGLPAAGGSDGEPAGVAELLAERLAVARAAALARALLARGTPPATFAVGVAPGAGHSVRFVFRLDRPDAASVRRD